MRERYAGSGHEGELSTGWALISASRGHEASFKQTVNDRLPVDNRVNWTYFLWITRLFWASCCEVPEQRAKSERKQLSVARCSADVPMFRDFQGICPEN